MMKCAVALSVAVALLPPLHCQTKAYLKMEIDPGNRFVRLSAENPKGFPNTEYFQQDVQQFRGQTRSSVDRVIPVGEGRARVFSELFYLNSDGIIVQRRKLQELFSVSGTPLVAESTYQYPEPGYGQGSIGFSVRADWSSIRREVPTLVDELPLSARPLNAITITRISKLRGVDVAAIATYTELGELFNVVVDPLKSGAYLPPPVRPQTVDEDIQASIKQFGLPLRLLVDQFRTEPTPLYDRTDGPAPLTLVSFHYARNRWVQQYIFDQSVTQSKCTKRVLEFRYTAQDESLRFFDDALAWRPAGDQRMYFLKK